tara:strand:+ start:3377 stop:7633 length:4257 start_codon:yes stop_codon:yes gene_type:complete
LKLHPFNLRRRLIAHKYRLAEFSSVIEDCERFLLKHPKDVFILQLKARAHTSMRDWESGWLAYSKVFEIDPNYNDSGEQFARCSVYTKKWDTLNIISKAQKGSLTNDSIQKALSKKLQSLPVPEFIQFLRRQEIAFALPDTTLKRWVNIDFTQRPQEILPIDKYCLDNTIGGLYLGYMLCETLKRSTSEARNTLHHFTKKYPISMISQWISPALNSFPEHQDVITDWLISYINPKEMSLQTLEALCASEEIPPHVGSIVSEYLSNCSAQEVKQAIRVIGRKSDPRHYVSDEVIRQMLSEGIDLSDSDPTVHTWMIEHMLRTEEYDLLKNIFSNQTKGIISPILKTIQNLIDKENEERLLGLLRLIVDSSFMLTNQKIRHSVSKMLLKIAEPEVAHSFAMESILLQPQDAVSGLVALQASVKTGCSKLILETADIVLNMKSRSGNIDYSDIAIAAIREEKLKFAEELLRENRLRSNLRAHRTRIGLQFFEYRDYQRTLSEIRETPKTFTADHTIILYEIFSLLELKRFDDAKKIAETINHPSERALALYLCCEATNQTNLAVSSINSMNERLGMLPFPENWLNSKLKFNSLPQTVNQLQFEQQHNELVSVILTTHKWNKFLPTALNSILNQTHTNFELIVVDDYSPIEDVKLYDKIMNDPRIKRVRMKNNSGTYECRNIGIKASKGKFVTFADSDDWMHPQKLEYSLTTLKKNNISLVINRFVRISEGGNIWFNGNKLSQFSLVGMMVSVEKLNEFDLKFDGRARFGADSEFLERAELLFGASEIKRTNFVELLALHHDDSLTGGGPNSIDWTGPGGARQRYAHAFRRNLDLIKASKADPSSMDFSSPTVKITSKYVTKTHRTIREILGVEYKPYEENAIDTPQRKEEEEIHVFMATYPGGFEKIGATVKCLLNQTIRFTKMTIHVNGLQTPPNIPADPRIEIINSKTNYADNGKFAHMEKTSGYIVTVDDDIEYPSDYLERMIQSIEIMNRKALIGVHGALLPTGPPVTRWSVYREVRRSHVFSHQHSSFNFVNVIGTGTMGFHSSVGRPDIDSMNSLRMVDLHVAVWAQKNNVPMYTMPREKNWMKEFEDLGNERIWQQANSDLELQNEMILTLSKVSDWNCEVSTVCRLTNGPLKPHKNWLSRELPPMMKLTKVKQWPKLPNNPKVTIYIPAFNVETYIEQCVESALAQTYEHFEISIHDDGSSDETWNILKRRYGDHPKIILNSLPNQGIGFATNSAISNGSGDLILQLDSDDFIEPDTLQVLVNAIGNNHVCAYGNFRRINPDGSLIDNGWEVAKFSRPRLLKDMIVHPPRLFRRDVWKFIGKHNQKLVNAEDFDLFLRMSEVGTMIHVRKILYSYRILQTSSTRSQSAIMTVNTHEVIKAALVRQGIKKFEFRVPNPNFPRRIDFTHVSFLEL